MASDSYVRLLCFILSCQSVLSIWECNENTDCQNMSGSVCINRECSCPDGKQSVLGGTACVDGAPYYKSLCYDDFQCSRLMFNFQCTKSINTSSTEAGACGCQPDYHYFKGRCWPSIGWGEKCTQDEECTSHLRDPFSMSCRSDVCECSDGYYLRQRGECRRSGKSVGEACVISEDCQFANGVCDTASFTCADSNNLYRNNTSRDLNKNIYIEEATSIHNENSTLSRSSLVRQHGVLCTGTCNEPFQCTTLGVCACPRGYYPNAAGTLCMAELGSPVTSPDQCQGFFKQVRDGICNCQSNFYFDEDMRSCVKVATRLTDFCLNDLSCHTFGASTRCGPPQQWGLRSCECIPEESVWNINRNMCMLFAGVGEQCEVDSDCLAGELEILCVVNDQGQGICSCPNGYEAIGGLCLKLGQELGDPCQVTAECTGTLNTVCAEGVCVCDNGYEQDGEICAPVIGGNCDEDSNCVIADTICSSSTNTCQCRSEFVEYEDACWPVVTEFGSPCNVTLQCLVSLGEGSSCTNGYCNCSGNHHYNDDACWPRTGLFESCSRSSECFLGDITERVQCRNNLCQCSFEYPYSEELKTCTSSAIGIFASYVTLATAVIYLQLTR